MGTFQDTASYQSGWAEGYINMCASLGIVSGYNDTAYGPGDTVTTWQAALMLQRALGYWNAAANESIDELAVTALATQLGFFGDLTLSANTPLAREDVAVMAFNALFAQRVAFDDYRGLYVKANDRNVVVTNGTDDPANTLAQNTYSLYMVEGTVTDNSFTNLNLMSDDRIPAMTTVVFDEVEDIDQNGRATDTEYDFDIETGLDLIGHAVNVYYRLVNGDVEAVAVIDDATLVGTIFAGASADMSRDANATQRSTVTVMSVIDDDAAVLNYDLTETVDANDIGTDTGHSGTYADNKLILISNSSNYQVDYVIVVAQTLDKLDTIDEDDYETVYELENAIPASRGKVVLTDEATQEGDYVLVTAIGGHSDVLVAEPAVVVDASITRLVGRSNNDDSTTLKRVEADGESYTESPVEDAENVSDTTEFQAIVTIGATTLVLDTDGLLVALAEEPEEDIGYAYVAQFGWTRDRTEDGLNYEDTDEWAQGAKGRKKLPHPFTDGSPKRPPRCHRHLPAGAGGRRRPVQLPERLRGDPPLQGIYRHPRRGADPGPPHPEEHGERKLL